MNDFRFFLKIAIVEKIKKIDFVLKIFIFQLFIKNIIIEFFNIKFFKFYLFFVVKKNRQFRLWKKKIIRIYHLLI